METPAKKEKGPVKRTSAKKRQLQSEKRRVANKAACSCIKTKVRAFRESVGEAPVEKSQERLQEIYSLADKAAKKNVYSRNKASRIKSRLAKSMRKSSVAA